MSVISTAWPVRSVWLGVSVENQATADARIPWLLKTPAALRFVSYEPALGPVDFTKICLSDGDFLGPYLHSLGLDTRLDWIICGGESGLNARPCHLAWLRSVVKQCQNARVPCWVKQLGSHSVGGCAALVDPDSPALWDSRFHWQHRAGADPSEWPTDLQVQQFPEVHDDNTHPHTHCERIESAGALGHAGQASAAAAYRSVL